MEPERERLKQLAVVIHTVSRNSAGQRTIAGEKVGRHKAKNLMDEANIKSKQPNKPKYKVAEQESKIAPNLLQCEFTVGTPFGAVV